MDPNTFSSDSLVIKSENTTVKLFQAIYSFSHGHHRKAGREIHIDRMDDDDEGGRDEGLLAKNQPESVTGPTQRLCTCLLAHLPVKPDLYQSSRKPLTRLWVRLQSMLS